MGQVVERGNEAPAVHLALVDLLRAVIEPGRIPKAYCVRGGEQAEVWVGCDHFVLIEQGEFAVNLQHALDNKHHVGAAGIVFVEYDGCGIAQRPRQDAFLEFGHLHAVAQFDCVLADKIDPADVAVEVDAHTGPIETACNLFDMGRLAGPVVALNHDTAVVGKPCQNGECCVWVKLVGVIALGYPVGHLRKALDHHVGIDAEHFAHVDVFGGFGVYVHALVHLSVIDFSTIGARWHCPPGQMQQ